VNKKIPTPTSEDMAYIDMLNAKLEREEQAREKEWFERLSNRPKIVIDWQEFLRKRSK
jgi:hypothetical protein